MSIPVGNLYSNDKAWQGSWSRWDFPVTTKPAVYNQNSNPKPDIKKEEKKIH